jgi:hypothetical protein
MSERSATEIEIKAATRNVVDFIDKTAESARAIGAPPMEVKGIISISNSLDRLFKSESFWGTINSSQSSFKEYISKELINFGMAISSAIPQDEYLFEFREKIVPRLQILSSLFRAMTRESATHKGIMLESGTRNRIMISDFRKEVSDFTRALNNYSKPSRDDVLDQEVGRYLENTQNENELLRARLETNQTELEINEERAISAEMRAEKLSTHVKQLGQALTTLEAKVTEYAQTESTMSELVSSAIDEKEQITKIRDEVQTLAASAADNVMAGNYEKLADDHAEEERFFRMAALILFGVSTTGAALIAWNVGWFGTMTDGSSPLEFWSSVVKKMLVAGGLAGIGLYCSRLASHHRRIEVWSRSLGVQLKTLESYLGGIKDENLKDSIREKFAGLTFGGPPRLESTSKSGQSDDTKAITELATAIATALRA